MKKLLFTVFLLSTFVAFSQGEKSFGIKAGLNYNSNGDLINEAKIATGDIKEGADSKVGFHVGVYGKLDFSNLYLRPELIFTKTKSGYVGVDNLGVAFDADYDISKLDLPVLLGYKIIGPLSVFAGPSFQYILDTSIKGINDVKLDDVKSGFTVGLNVGIGVQLGNLGLDVRYERGFSKNEADIISNNAGDVAEVAFDGRIDSRPSQLIFSASFKL